MEKQSALFVLVALIIGFMLGMFLTLLITPTLLVERGAEERAIEIKKQFLSELRERGYLPEKPSIITNVYGQVKNVSEDTITLILKDNIIDPFRELLPEIMTVRINEETEMFVFEEKPLEVFEQEQKAFEERMKEYQGEIPIDIFPPDFFTKTTISLTEIKEGDMINASSDTDFKGKSEFAASSIQLERIK